MKPLNMFLCLISISSFSQNCNNTLKGIVEDFHDGTTIHDATVYIKQLNKYTTTNAEGRFLFEDLCNGTLTLVISHLNCETKTIDVDINTDSTLNIVLEHHIEELNEVTLKGGSKKETQTSQETILRSKDIEQFSSESLGDALKQVSGVSSINTGNTIVKPIINGLHSSRIIIMTNGVRLQDQEWGIEHAPNIDINSSNSISVIKGADALAYGGDAIGGVVILKPARAILKDSLFGKVILSGQTNGRGGSISGSISKTYEKGWYINGQTSLKRYGDFEAPDYSLTNTGLDSKSFSLNTGYQTFEKGFNVFYSYVDNTIAILRASHLGNVEDLVNAINSPEPLVIEDFSYDINAPKQEVKHHLLKAEIFKRIKSFGKLSLQYDYQNNQRFEFDLRRGDTQNKAAVDLQLQTHTIKANLKIDKNTDKTINIGLLGSYQDNFANPNTGVSRLIPDYDRYDFGAFAIGTFKLNDKTTLNSGVRYDYNYYNAKKFYQKSRWEERGYDVDFVDIIIDDIGTQYLTNPEFTFHNISASTGLLYDLNDHNSLKFNYGLSNRSPNPSELFSDGLHHSAARIELGDLRIDKETSSRISGSYAFNKNGLGITIESYFNLIDNFIYIEPTGETPTTIRGAFPVWEYKQTNVRLVGIDFTGRYQFNRTWSIENNTSLTKGWDRSNDRALIHMPPFETTTTLSFNKASLNNLHVDLISENVLRQNEFPNNNFETFIPTTNETKLVDISTPPPSYHLIHLNSSVDFELNSRSKLSLGLQVNNLFNASYRNYLNQLRYFADDLGRNLKLQLKLNF